MEGNLLRHTTLAGMTLALMSTTALADPTFDPYAAPQNTGPSSSDGPASNGAVPTGAPYYLPTSPGWSVTSLLTVGNSVPLTDPSTGAPGTGTYTMVGVPDGLGAFDNGNGTITVLMNHELSNGQGPVSGDQSAEGETINVPEGIDTVGAIAHGGTNGAFVDEYVIDKNTLQVLSGGEFVTTPSNFNVWDPTANSGAGGYVTGAAVKAGATGLNASVLNISRLCSADLAPTSSFYNAATGKGYNGQIFLDGEEGGTLGRGFAWVVGPTPSQNTAYELPKIAGSFTSNPTNSTVPAFENLVANPSTGDKTIVAGGSDGGTKNVAIYIGTKTNTGTAVDKAGLNDGAMWSLQVNGVAAETNATNVGLTAATHGLGTGTTAQVSLVAANNGTSFLRPEDEAWDPTDPNRLYFVTTNALSLPPGQNVDAKGNVVTPVVNNTRLWAVTFNDVQGLNGAQQNVGTIQLLLDGAPGNMYDNIGIDANGIITIDEDTGNAAHNSKVWQYDPFNGDLTQLFETDPTLFGQPGAG